VGEFGDKFRKAREKKELSFDQVSNVTKIGARMLQAIEEEHFDVLPGGVFNKGFIRAYAKHLGLDPEETVTDYLTCLRQAQINAHEVWEPERPLQPRSAAPERHRPVESSKAVEKSQSPVQVEELPELQLPRAEPVRPPREDFAEPSAAEIPWRILAVAAVVLVLAVILWTRHSHRAADASTSPAKSARPTVAPSAAASVSAPAPAATHSKSKIPTASATTVAHSSTPNPQPPQDAQSRKAVPASRAVSETSTASSVDITAASDVTTRTFKKPTSTSSLKAAVPLTLVIRAQETSWISVQADGQTVSQETLIAPAHASIRATREIVARIGNAAGVTFLWNGKEIPADGAEAEVKTFAFDANGVRVLPSTQAPLPGR
jgi:cytoskeletal protein RodZ